MVILKNTALGVKILASGLLHEKPSEESNKIKIYEEIYCTSEYTMHERVTDMCLKDLKENII